jgi:alkanesulfonate monooxygenase SsuD/methylene tetrahydromethanopterin reductase-like flavin-dependent oxidoreductase (luciferase family)
MMLHNKSRSMNPEVSLRLSIAMFLGPTPAERDASATAERIVRTAELAEQLGYAGVWVTDSAGRGVPTLDALSVLCAVSAATRTIELGTGVLQVPLRNPVDIAFRAQSLAALSNGRFRLGLGAGSTQADFEMFGADYEHRFRTLGESLTTMQRLWAGEAVGSAQLQAWPGAAPNPPVFLGAWRSERWIGRAARDCAGWISSGLHGNWEGLTEGMRIFRANGGKRAIMTNIPADLRDAHATYPNAKRPLMITGTMQQARDHVSRMEQAGLDDIALLAPGDAPEHVKVLRELLP